MKIEIFDPPMCCPTGVCGPNTDPALLKIHEAFLALKKSGVDIERYSMTHQFNQFMQNEVIAKLINDNGLDVLPVTLVNGKVLATKGYPSYEEMEAAIKG